MKYKQDSHCNNKRGLNSRKDLTCFTQLTLHKVIIKLKPVSEYRECQCFYSYALYPRKTNKDIEKSSEPFWLTTLRHFVCEKKRKKLEQLLPRSQVVLELLLQSLLQLLLTVLQLQLLSQLLLLFKQQKIVFFCCCGCCCYRKVTTSATFVI